MKVNERTRIETKELNPKIMENIDVLENILTFWEFWVLKILELKKTALTTQEIRNKILLKISDDLRKGQIKDFDVVYTNKIITKKELQELRIKIKEELKKREPTYLFIKSLEKLMDKILGIKIPSYKKIENMLLALEKMGLVGRRYDTLKKGKWLWVLNPMYIKALKISEKK